MRIWSVVLLALVATGTAPSRAAQQTPGVVHIRVALPGGDGQLRPIRRHALLVSDEPVTAAPRRVVTGADGTVDIRLKPGSYVIESDEPATFQGKAYTWRQVVAVEAGKEAVLELNAANAQVETVTGAAEADLDSVFEEWQDSVVTVWSETSYGLGFLVDPAGLIATSQRVVGASTSAEVEIAGDRDGKGGWHLSAKVPATFSGKVAARVVAANPDKDVAILWVNPKVVASVRPVRLDDGTTPVAAGQRVLSVGNGSRGRRFMTTATVSRVDPKAIVSDIIVDPGSAGAPVLASDGQAIGITSLVPGDDNSRGTPAVVRIDDARGLIAEAKSKTSAAAPPDATPLPIEPSRPFPETALQADAGRRMRSAIDYQLKAADFDVTFVTPPLMYGVYHRARQVDARSGAGGTRTPGAQDLILSADSFENWAKYAAEFPPVLMIRVTPRLVEGFWSLVGRQAARTQGVSLPPLARHVKAGFTTMRVLCGETPLVPIHPFRIEHRVPAKANSAKPDQVIYEGLYVFDPNAVGPGCGTVTLVLSSDKNPAKTDTRAVDARLVQQIWDDFAPWRAAGA